MPRVNWKRPVPCVLSLSLVASMCVMALPTAAQQAPVDRHAEIGRVSKELSEKPSESLAKDALPNRITTLLKAKRDALRMRYEANVQAFEADNIGFTEVTRSRVDLIDAELELTTIATDRIKLLREHVDGTAMVADHIFALWERGRRGGEQNSMAAAQAAKFDAELRLARELVAQRAM